MNTDYEHNASGALKKKIITDAAGRCIINKEGSMKEIQDESGMGAGKIYRYFRSKKKTVGVVIENKIVEQCNLLSIICRAAESNTAKPFFDVFFKSEAATRVLKLNIILRVESNTHLELKKIRARLQGD